ncbi:MAG: hypothetical protein MJ182_09895 [Treponema sp.]|nr:hypothetical protein [Treponema sp.]
MNLKIEFKILLVIFTYLVLILDALSVLPRSKKLFAQTGNLKMKLKNRSKTFFIGNYLWAFFLPAIILIRDFKPLYELMFCLVSIMGCEMNTRDFVSKGQYGIFENCAIANGVIIFYDDIVTFPILNLPEDEQEKYDHANLVVATKSKGNENLVFANQEECATATALIRELSGK